MSPTEIKKKISDDKRKNNAKKIVYTFFGVCVLWFSYSIFKITSFLIFN